MSRYMQQVNQQAHLFVNGKRPQSLWITCLDHAMDSVIDRVVAAAPTLILRQPGLAIVNEPHVISELIETITNVVTKCDLTEVVFCGHSMCCEVPSELRVLPSLDRNGGIDDLMQRSRRREAINQYSREQVVGLVQQLSRRVLEHDRPNVKRLKTYGLFYLVESGTFTRYDECDCSFSTIAC